MGFESLAVKTIESSSMIKMITEGVHIDFKA